VSGGRTTPIWLAHHWPDQYDRCVVVGHRHVCRRCAFMYPMAFVVTGLSLAGLALPSPWSQVALAVLPLPALIEFVGEHRRWWAYSAPRQAALGTLQGIGMGVGFGRYLETPSDPWFWVIAVGYSLIAFVAAITAPRSVEPDGASEPADGAG
jgi:hypothetical protein